MTLGEYVTRHPRSERYIDYFAEHPIKCAVAWMVTTRIVSASLYSVAEEGADWYDGFWWGGVTQSTTGYGDLSPEGMLVRTAAEVLWWSGILGVAIITGALAVFINSWRNRHHGVTEELHDDIEQWCVEQQAQIERLQGIADELERREKALKPVKGTGPWGTEPT